MDKTRQQILLYKNTKKTKVPTRSGPWNKLIEKEEKSRVGVTESELVGLVGLGLDKMTI